MQMPMGQYRPGNTFFSSGGCEGKLLGLCLVIAAVIVSKGLFGCIAAAAAALTVSYLAGIFSCGADKNNKRDVSVFSSDLLMNAFFTAGSIASGAAGFFRLSRRESGRGRWWSFTWY